MAKIHFTPWEGKNYRNGGCFGKKILVLGESHYGTDLGSAMTHDIIHDHAYSDYRMRAYTIFERTLLGRKSDYNDSERIWNSVAYYNYVQECISKPRTSPTRHQFEESEAAFFEMLDNLEPDVVLVWGRRLWNELPCKNFISYEDCEYEGYKFRCVGYKTKNGVVVPCYEMWHPAASGYSWDWWHNYLVCNGIIPECD